MSDEQNHKILKVSSFRKDRILYSIQKLKKCIPANIDLPETAQYTRRFGKFHKSALKTRIGFSLVS